MKAAFEENGSKASIEIKLLKDTTSTELITASDSTTVIEVELNGHSLTCAISAQKSVLRPKGNGKLTTYGSFFYTYTELNIWGLLEPILL